MGNVKKETKARGGSSAPHAHRSYELFEPNCSIFVSNRFWGVAKSVVEGGVKLFASGASGFEGNLIVRWRSQSDSPSPLTAYLSPARYGSERFLRFNESGQCS
jgi:hypothetical protein